MNLYSNAWSYYLPKSPETMAWGLHVVDAGYSLIGPNSPYPPGQHPQGHMFTWEQGRTLESYTLVYITQGQGVLETKRTGLITIQAGQLFILYPGEWHRYQPDIEIGWDEYWVEFSGEQAHKMMEHPALANKKVLHSIGANETILKRLIEINEATQTQALGFELIIATYAAQIIAHLIAHLQYASPEMRLAEKAIRGACLHILQHANQDIHFADLAQKSGLSYSVFRHRFKSITGLAPNQYLIQVRLNKARELLKNSTRSIQKISDQLGFSSVYYFSRLFKKKLGESPLQYRQRIRANHRC